MPPAARCTDVLKALPTCACVHAYNEWLDVFHGTLFGPKLNPEEDHNASKRPKRYARVTLGWGRRSAVFMLIFDLISIPDKFRASNTQKTVLVGP